MIVKLQQYNEPCYDGHEELRSRGHSPDLWLLKAKGGMYEWGCRGYGLAIFKTAAEAHSAMQSLTKEAAREARTAGNKVFLVPPEPTRPPDVLFDGKISSLEA